MVTWRDVVKANGITAEDYAQWAPGSLHTPVTPEEIDKVFLDIAPHQYARALATTDTASRFIKLHFMGRVN